MIVQTFSLAHLKQANQFSLLLSEKVGNSALLLSFLLMSQLNLTCSVCLLPPKRHCLAQSYFNQMKMIYMFLKDGSCKVNGFHILLTLFDTWHRLYNMSKSFDVRSVSCAEACVQSIRTIKTDKVWGIRDIWSVALLLPSVFSVLIFHIAQYQEVGGSSLLFLKI